MNKKIIIIISVVGGLLVVGVGIMLTIIILYKKDSDDTSTANINYDNICASQTQQQGYRGNMTPPNGTGSGSLSDMGAPPTTSGRPEMPSGYGQMTRPSGVPQDMGQMDKGDMEFMSFLKTACSDDELSDEEKTEFDKLYTTLSDEAKERFNFSK